MSFSISQEDYMEYMRLKAEAEAGNKLEAVMDDIKESINQDKVSKKYGGIKWDEKKKAFMVRVNHRGKQYTVKNYTEMFNCKNIADVEKQIEDNKDDWDRGLDPYDTKNFGERMEFYLENLSNKNTSKTSRNSYEKHCKSILHEKKIKELSQSDIKKIYSRMKQNQDVNSVETVKRVRSILSPIYTELFETRKIDINYLRREPLPDFENDNELLSINERLLEVDYKIIGRKLYKGIMKVERDDIRNFLLLTLMTGRRRAEVFRTTKKHVHGDKIIATKDITKTKIKDGYPICDEVKDYIKNSEKEFIFKCDEKSYYRAWKKILKEEEIEFKQVFRVYDTRHLLTSTMQEIHPHKSKIIDECLSHIPKNIENTYLGTRFEERKKIFEEYWNILRS